MERSAFNYSINTTDLHLERMALEHHHRNTAVMENDPDQLNDGREFVDRPFAGIAILAGFFLLITLILCILILIFYKKRNTVFVYEKSVHRGLTASLGDRSVVIGHASGARRLASQYAYNSEVGSTEDESTEHDSCEGWEVMQATAQSTFPSTPDYCPAHLTRAAYNIRPNDELIANFQVLRQQYLEGSICAKVQAHNPDGQCETMNENKELCRSFVKSTISTWQGLPITLFQNFTIPYQLSFWPRQSPPSWHPIFPLNRFPGKKPLIQAKQPESLPNN